MQTEVLQCDHISERKGRIMVDCLSVRGFSAEKQVQHRMSFLFCIIHFSLFNIH